MKILIAYTTKHGCTEKCVKKLASQILNEALIVNLKAKPKLDISQFDVVLIGGSIQVGKIQKQVKSFCENNLSELKKKKIGLFVCCMSKEDEAIAYINELFPEDLVKTAVAKEYFGWEVNFERMNFIERFIMKKIAKTNKSVSHISEENISKFASTIKNIK